MPRLPVLATLRGYRVSWLGPDAIAGLTLVAIAIPEQMATAHLAGMAPVAGFYAFVAGTLLFALLGRDPHISVGADSTIAPTIALGAAAALGAGSVAATQSASSYVHAVSLMALMAGAVLLLVGLVRLGWIAELLSQPVITGVLGGIGIEIFVHQLPSVLGIPAGGSDTVSRISHVVSRLGHTNGDTAAIAIAVLAIVVIAERIDRRIPGALIGLALSVACAAAFHLGTHGVALVGSVKGGLPPFGFPNLGPGGAAELRRLAVPVLIVVFLCIAQTAATLRAHGTAFEAADFDRDLLAIGAGSLAAGLAGSFAVDSSPPRTEIVRSSGGRSQMAGLLAAAVVLAVANVATGVLKDLPFATLGAILVFIASRLVHVKDLRTIASYDRIELALALVSLVAVGFWGIEQGVLIAMVLSLADRTRHIARPRDVVLGREPGTDHWIPPDIGRPTEQVPGLVVYMPYAPLWYGNASFLRTRIRGLVRAAPSPVRAFVLDANAMSDIDYTGARMFDELAAELKRDGITVAVARSSHLVHHDLKHGGLLAEIGAEHLYASVEEAVEALSPAIAREASP